MDNGLKGFCLLNLVGQQTGDIYLTWKQNKICFCNTGHQKQETSQNQQFEYRYKMGAKLSNFGTICKILHVAYYSTKLLIC